MPQNIESKSILNRKKKRDPRFLDDYTINPFSGCSFNCLYCYVRGSKYGEHMEEKLSVKANAVELLEKQLALEKRKGRTGYIVMSSATDPYLHIEEELQLTRQLLQVISAYKFPVHIITKGPLVERDFDLLHQIDREAIIPPDLARFPMRGVYITFSFSTLVDEVGHRFEPGAPSPSSRLRTLSNTCKNGFSAGVSLMPLLPFISETGLALKQMLSRFKVAGADYIFPAGLTLFGNGPADSYTLTLRAVKKHYPELHGKYEELFRPGSNEGYRYHHQLDTEVYNYCRELGINMRIVEGLG